MEEDTGTAPDSSHPEHKFSDSESKDSDHSSCQPAGSPAAGQNVSLQTESVSPSSSSTERKKIDGYESNDYETKRVGDGETSLPTQTLPSQVRDESDNDDEEFLSAEEGEEDDNEDEDRKLEEWSESLPDPKSDGAVSSEDTEEVEQAIAAATSDTGEEGECGEKEEGDAEAGEEKEGDDKESGEQEDSKEEEEERKRQEEEDAMTEEELQTRLAEAVKVKTKGNDTFKSGQHSEALELYSQALQLCPLKYIHQRALMLSNRAACRIREGDYEMAVKDCSKSIKQDPNYIKAYFRRADAYEKLEKLEEALKDHQKVVELDRSQAASFHACVRLEKEIEERNEKLKTEMLGKLKDLGNMVLRPFGLSTNNFQLQQDPNTGSYSVQFLQTPPTNGR